MLKLMMSVLLLFTSFGSFSATFVEGQDYQLIKSDTPSLDEGDGVHVTEFFSYGCPWCYRLEAGLEKWATRQGSAIYLSKVPVVFNKDWDYYARAYYIIHSFSLGKSVDSALFKAIVTDKKPLNSPQAMVSFFTEQGMDKKLVESAFSHSPSIEIRLKADQSAMFTYQINAVPTLVVADRYKTNLMMAKTETRLFEILDYLVAQAKKEKPE